MFFRRQQATIAAADTSTRFTPAPYVVAAMHGTDTALLDMRAERYYTLDEVGSRIWTLLVEGRSPDDIASQLGEEFDAPHDIIAHDLGALLARLEKASIILPGAEAGER
jgi:hypothetical protein